jgi:hypothetical protein
MPHADGTRFHPHQSFLALVHLDFKDGASHGDDRCGRRDPQRGAVVCQVLNLQADPSQIKIHKVSQVEAIGAKDDSRIGEDF